MLKKQILALAALSSLGFLPMAQAADKVVDDRFYIAPFGTFIQPGGDRQSDNGWGGGMGGVFPEEGVTLPGPAVGTSSPGRLRLGALAGRSCG